MHNHNGTAEGEDVEVAGVSAQGEHHEGEEEHGFGDVMIHQVNTHLSKVRYVLLVNRVSIVLGHPYHRIRSWIGFSHSLLFAFVGPQLGSFS